ncbi:thiopurine S-methyltransferase [Acidihalobacter aeolianus]|uniref:Thiopurine S-methyltransferase n=1 Tax=Acidihalobacter aeolianus TaxID=2792603 RepID=A0A1D8K9U8_9GAMM|nr:thiopurine S-methyltransferase [Acidihalobacter aeolianus]AOV17749.1 thiopurine S-methyltransferase [Acidihalobacter aeolianus]
MQSEFWLERWRNQQIGFHQERINPHLEAHWPALDAKAGTRVFVPLCGKSRDMLWLAAQGYRVTGIELSPLAVEAFFAESDLAPTRRHQGIFEVCSAGEIEIFCGDFFALSAEDLAGVTAVYDRASLVALPPDMRQRYAAHMAHLLPPDVQILLVTFDYSQDEMSGPPFAVSEDEVHGLYDDTFAIRKLADLDALAENARFRQAGLTRLRERVFVLHRR